MGIIRKIVPSGHTSKAVTIPSGWLRFVEQQSGECLGAVIVTEANNCLIIRPYFEKQKNKGEIYDSNTK
ncbi:MAG: hypothetical protein LBH74_03700 [Nitrososphaerota archaeon]|jgi:hypothetical protein|nr:hypothetical protein [Nitrososphaerota archaeon]